MTSLIETCHRKVQYASWETAEAAALNIMDRKPDGKGPLHAYRCEHCGLWHVGHLVPSYVRERRRTKAGRRS